jgi:hypothetical protein
LSRIYVMHLTISGSPMGGVLASTVDWEVGDIGSTSTILR